MCQIQLLFLDTETTGLPAGKDYSNINITEIGWVITDINFNKIKEENHLINGDFEITDKITEITGITKQMTIDNGKEITKVLDIFFNDLKGCQFYIAHNMNYDYNVIKQELTNNKLTKYIKTLYDNIQICSMNVLKNIFKENDIKLLNNKLNTCHNYLIKYDVIQTHRALDDVNMIIACFKQIENYNIIIHTFCNNNISFGKYKGNSFKFIYNNDKRYFIWLLSSKYLMSKNICEKFINYVIKPYTKPTIKVEVEIEEDEVEAEVEEAKFEESESEYEESEVEESESEYEESESESESENNEDIINFIKNSYTKPTVEVKESEIIEEKETIDLEYLQDNIVKNKIIKYINEIDEYKNIINNNKDKKYELLNIQLFNIIQHSHLNYLRHVAGKPGIIQDYCNTIPNYNSLYYNSEILRTIHR